MMLAARDLAFGYPGHPVGHDVTLSLKAGEVVCLLGPNGGGKTTLFKTLIGLLKPQGGSVAIDGEDIAHWSPRRLAQVIGYVPQAHAGYFPFTVEDVVLMGRTAHVGLFAAPSPRDRAVAQEALDTLGLTKLADQVYTRISGGERQLVLIARALAQQPRILVMDEPTANLDFGNQLRVLAQVSALARGGMTVVLSTHDPDHAFHVADRVAMLHGGRLVRLGPPDEAVTRDSLREVYGVEIEVVAIAGGRRVCVPALRPA
jgi:iron complex transport system ATP-binding protein